MSATLENTSLNLFARARSDGSLLNLTRDRNPSPKRNYRSSSSDEKLIFYELPYKRHDYLISIRTSCYALSV